MNIFYLDNDIETCARYHCDKHVIKMITEYCQILSTNKRILDGYPFYKLSKNGRKILKFRLGKAENDLLCWDCHHNHPSTKWVRESLSHYMWLCALTKAISKRYTEIYGKVHKYERIGLIDHLTENPPKNLEDKGFVQPPKAMKNCPHLLELDDSVEAYRRFYIEAKASFAYWNKKDPESVPSWYPMEVYLENFG